MFTPLASLQSGQAVRVHHKAGLTELATIDSVISGPDFPAVYVTYADRTTGRVSPSQVEPAARIAAQVAVEAIANDPTAYEESTRAAVLANGEANGVAALYLDLIR